MIQLTIVKNLKPKSTDFPIETHTVLYLDVRNDFRIFLFQFLGHVNLQYLCVLYLWIWTPVRAA